MSRSSGRHTESDQSLRQLVLSLYVPTLIMSVCGGLIVPILPLLALDFEVSYGMTGVVLAASGIGTLISDIPAGTLIRRIGYRKGMVAGAIIMFVAALAVFSATSILQLFLYRLVTGAGLTLWAISRQAYLYEAIKLTSRGRASAMMGGIGRLTGFVAPALGGLMGETLGLRSPFLLYALLSLVALVVTLALVPKPDLARREVREARASRFRDHLKENLRIILRGGPGYAVGQITRSSRNVIIPLFAAEVLGLSPWSIGLITSLSFGVDLILVYPAGVVMDRFGRKFAYVPSFFMQGVALSLIPFTESFVELLVVAMGLGFANGMGAGTMLTLAGDLAPEKARGDFLGMWHFVGDAGAASAPLIMGRVGDLAGLGASAFVAGGSGILAAALLGFLTPETLVRSTKAGEKAEGG